MHCTAIGRVSAASAAKAGSLIPPRGLAAVGLGFAGTTLQVSPSGRSALQPAFPRHSAALAALEPPGHGEYFCQARQSPAVDREVAPEPQRLGFARRARVGVGDMLEFGDMGEAENATVHFDAGKAERVLPDRVQQIASAPVRRRGRGPDLRTARGDRDARPLGPPQMREFAEKSRQTVEVTPRIHSR